MTTSSFEHVRASGPAKGPRGVSGSRFARVVWRISLPIIFVEATEALDHLIDSLFLARVGVTELGAIAVADTVLLLFLILPLGLVDGIQVLTARRLGQRRDAAVGAVFGQGLLLVLLVAAASTAALKLLWPALAPWFVESDEVGDVVDGYLQIAAFGIGPIGITFAFGALLTSLGRTWALVPATVILVVGDVLFDYAFVLGGFGCPALGMRGAALGSLLAELATLLFLALYSWRRLDTARYRLFRRWRLDVHTVRVLARLAVPIAGLLLVTDLGWVAFFLIQERQGLHALAIGNLVFTCYLVFRIPTEGFAETSCSMVARCAGRNRPHRVGRVLHTALRGALIVTMPLLVASLVAPATVLAMFVPDAELLRDAAPSLRVVALTMLIAIPGELWFGAVIGAGATTTALGIGSAQAVTMVGLAWLAAIGLLLPPVLVWVSLPAGWLVCLWLSWGWIRAGRWQRPGA
jgi:Na+-driven multidrug efflux pump